MKAKIVAFAALLIAAMSSGVMAQNAEELQRFNAFLDKHPELAQRLAADPRLVNNPHFVASHPNLEKFLASHPGVHHSLQAAPGQFMYREGHYEWKHGGGPIAAAPTTGSGPTARFGTSGEVVKFNEGYLEHHPEVARQLRHNPALIDNPQFLAAHPGLEHYLVAHPRLRAELQSNPSRFMGEE
jgi:hypothetical protein